MSLRSTAGAARPLPPRARPRPPEPPRHRVLWMLGLGVLGVGLVVLLHSVLTMLFAAAVFAWMLDPAIDRLEARGWSRDAGIGLTFAAMGLGLTLLVLIVVPMVAGELHGLAGNLGGYIDTVKAALVDARALVEARLGRPIPVEPALILQEMQAALIQEQGGVGEAVRNAAPSVGRWLARLLTAALTGGMGFLLAVLNLTLLPIFTFYLLRDWDRLIAAVDALVPVSRRAQVRRLAGDIDLKLGSFVRGQLTICAVLGALYTLGLLVSGIDLAVVVGLGSGALFIVPYLGTVVGVVLASALALLKFGFDWHILMVWATFGGAQALEGMVITPRVMGESVGLHPLVVMLALIVGGNLYGLFGMLLAIPVTAAADVLLREWLSAYRASRFFSDEGA